MTSITTRSSSPGEGADEAGGRVTSGRPRANFGRPSATRSLLVITPRSCRSAGAQRRLPPWVGACGQTMSVKGAPHSRAQPPGVLRPVNSVCATPRYSSSPVGGIEDPGLTVRRPVQSAVSVPKVVFRFQMTTCPNCGHENEAGATFCSQCDARLAERRPAGATERKVLTVLFADLVGFTSRSERLDPEDVEAVLAPYHERLRYELERWGGTVEKFIGDAVMALFGAPVTREDDPERAVRAALAIRDWIAEEGELQVRIAVNTGEALVNLAARSEAGEGMAAGDVVNTAARLQSAAPVNGILVGETTYRATAETIDYSELPDVEADGQEAPIPVWEVVQARARFGVDLAPEARTPLVGREREVEQLVGALERARRQRSTELVTVAGVPGIGKSRLVGELFQSVERGGELMYWRQGRSLPYGQGVSYWALAEMVKAQAGILETDGDAEVEAKLSRTLEQLLDEDVDWVLSHLHPLVGHAGDGASGSQEEAFAAWRRFFEALAEQRTIVLVFEDIQWADDGLLD